MSHDCIFPVSVFKYLAEAYIQIATEKGWQDHFIMQVKDFYAIIERASFIQGSREKTTMTDREFVEKWQTHECPQYASQLYWQRAYDLPWPQVLEMSKDYVNTEGSHGSMSYMLANILLERQSKNREPS